MFLKCSQKNNRNYTFGVTEKQIKEAQSIEDVIVTCSSCGTKMKKGTNFCSSCGEKL
jgi:rRNA maturation endonuclease Nob1